MPSDFCTNGRLKIQVVKLPKRIEFPDRNLLPFLDDSVVSLKFNLPQTSPPLNVIIPLCRLSQALLQSQKCSEEPNLCEPVRLPGPPTL